MAHKRIHKNFDFLSNYDYFVPDVKGIAGLTIWFIAGALLGSVVTVIISSFINDHSAAMTYSMVVSYPIMFIPPMMYASLKSRNNSFFGKGRKLSNSHYSPLGWPVCVIMVMLATLAAAFICDGIGSLMPDVPAWLEDVLSSMTQGNILIDLICVSIFAPIFEEWLCRGEVLRGLLNYEHKNKAGETVHGIKPAWAIVISAAFFAIIHGNPWQAVPAFTLGCLFGYVYYKTGSIKLTMLMHCTNNTFAVIISNIDSLKDIDSWMDVMKPSDYGIVMLLCVAFILLFLYKFNGIKPQSPQGNCDEVGE
ncbi:MAG: CPBP family intramembrane metalloprotease [Bacteroidia bacterium]|nr:CPBP family intramembrane metalloprotease [Bacteroidia bacterium]